MSRKTPEQNITYIYYNMSSELGGATGPEVLNQFT